MVPGTVEWQYVKVGLLLKPCIEVDRKPNQPIPGHAICNLGSAVPDVVPTLLLKLV